MLVEWQLEDGTTYISSGGEFTGSGVTVEVRTTSTANGTRYDVRLRNRTGTDYNYSALRVRLQRAGTDTVALTEGQTVSIPAELRQWWEPSQLEGAKYGFVFEVKTGTTSLLKVGPSTVDGMWGGRSSGVVRVDGKAYIVPEFWQRQPRKISITQNEILITLFEGADQALRDADDFEPLRAGEDLWDRFAVLDHEALADADLIAQAKGVPQLSPGERQALLTRFDMAEEGIAGPDSETEAWLRKYDQWQGTSWEKRYADDLSGRYWAGEEDSTHTALFSLFERGFFYAVSDPGIYTFREYGDIQWNQGMSDLHYDWLRAALKHYLRTGSESALQWAMAAMRHAVSTDYVWESAQTPARNDYLNLAGLARYEKGDHGGADFLARPTHTWGEGLFLAAAITNDPWVVEAATGRAEGVWRYWRGPDPALADDCGETRVITWPLLLLVRAFKETGTIKYWEKAHELMGQVLAQEQASGGAGYVTHRCGWGNENNAQSLMNGYSARGMIAFAEEAKERGEWTAEYLNLMRRWAAWLSTPVPDGAYFPDGTYFETPDPGVTYGTFAYFFCPPGLTCTQPTSASGEVVYNMMAADLFAWLAANDPGGSNPNTGASWRAIARRFFKDAVNHGPQPYGIVGFLTNAYPTTETKALGWMQLFLDYSAQYLARAPALSLLGGWNFFSIPNQPDDTSISSVLSTLLADVVVVWSYDTEAGGWLMFKPGASPEQNTLENIEAGRGYWIYVRNPGSIATSGAPLQPVSLREGWNLVGYTGSESRPVGEALAGLAGAWSIVWTWDNGSWQAAIPGDSVTLPVEPLTSFRQDKAYWIRINPGTGTIIWNP